MPILRLVAVAVLLVSACAPAGASDRGAGGAATADPGSQAAAAPADGAPVLLELFTSQGCSSCPPADRLLSELADDPQLAGRVVPLAFHVDYWNYIGWQDPFSSARWSERQRRYAQAMDDGRVYTPQLVVNGRRHLVGSRRGDVLQAVREAAAEPPAARLGLTLGTVSGGALPVTVAAHLLRDAGDEPLTLYVVLWQDGLVTPVSRGENADRVLRDDRVVRRLVRAAEVPAAAGSDATARIELRLDADWPRGELGVAAFLQQPGAGAVLGAAGERLEGAAIASDTQRPSSR